MSKLSPIGALKEADLQIPDGPVDGQNLRETFRRFFQQLNPWIDGVNKLSSKGVSLTDNLLCDLVTGTFSHGVAQQVALTNLTRAGSALILSAEGQVPFAAAVKMVAQDPKKPPALSVTLYFRDTAATKVKTTLLILPEGTQTTVIPAP